ncbi:MATE family efflux transporter [Beduini massiliensis]|uniref:MATE family efflux transporter n=1 Tax=Beduini massiliensis TaxID=1585974 RepID=UPI00059AAD94|nr:MATE family efflux transporter [Beduini massiliensis]
MRLKKYICDKAFLKMVCTIAAPIILQQIVETLVGLADSMMVSGYSEFGVSAVQIGSQWEQIATLLSFGICSGVGIYTAQFFGSQDYKNLKKSFGTMIMLSVAIAIPFILAAVFIPKIICGFYISDPTIIHYGSQYLIVTGISYVFVMVSFCFNYTYRCMSKTKVTMVISSITVLLNCLFNYLLIFGHFGFPELGIVGAAYGTLISRGLGTLMYVIYSTKTKQVFLGKLSVMFKPDPQFLQPVIRRILPTVANEGLFGVGQTLFFKAFGMIGVHAVTSVAIADRISNLFFMVIWAIVSAVQAIIGNTLGKNDMKLAKTYADYFMGMGLVVSVVLGLLMVITAPYLIGILYANESGVVQQAATFILYAYAIKIGLRLFNAVIFGFLRAGGDTKVLALLDSVILYTVGLPLAFLCVTVFHFDIVPTIILIQLEQVIRIILAFKRYRSGAWMQNVTADVN